MRVIGPLKKQKNANICYGFKHNREKCYSKNLLSFLIFSILSVFSAIRYFFLLGRPKTPNTPYTPIRFGLFIIKYAIIEYVVGFRAPIGARLSTIFEN